MRKKTTVKKKAKATKKVKKAEGKKVTVHQTLQSEPMVHEGVRNTYQKGDLYCVWMNDRKTVYKYPIQGIHRIIEVYA